MRTVNKFETATRIVTHPGEAHRDELLAVAVVLGLNRWLPVERRDATQVDLQDPAVIVLDQGGRHDPALSDFDHHQLGRDEPAACTLTLLLGHLGLLATAHELWPWLSWT